MLFLVPGLVLCFGFFPDLDALDSLTLALVNDVGVDLGRADIGGGKQMGDRVDIRALVHLEGCEGMAEAVEGDVLGDARGLDPLLQRCVRIIVASVTMYQEILSLKQTSNVLTASEFLFSLSLSL